MWDAGMLIKECVRASVDSSFEVCQDEKRGRWVVGLGGGGEKLKADGMVDPDGSATAHIRAAAGVCEFHKG